MTIKKGSKVSFNYELTVDGKVVDSSEGKEPLSFEQGNGTMIPGVEEAIEGMKVGEKKTVTVPPEKAYGPREEKAVQKVPKKNFDNSENIKVGDMISVQAGEQVFPAVVKELDDESITLDMNHPLAGKTLEFKIEITDVK